jgi:ADP-heptose:LPS heptosyltransferase
MHILTIPHEFDLGPQGKLPTGEFLCEDRNAAELMLRIPGATMRPAEPSLSNRESPTAILIVAPVGFGDAILLTPCLRQLKALHPAATLTVATLPEYRQIFLGLPYVDGFADYPLPAQQLAPFDCVFCLERSLEDNPRGREQHMTDRFAEHLGLPELEDKTADYRVSAAERDWVTASFPRTKKRRIGVQVQAGARCRSYPRIGLMVEALRRADWEVYLIGRPGEFRVDGLVNADVVDLSRRGLTWRQSAAFLLTCDVVLAPDSSMLHAAGALDIPAVGLFGPFPWKLRTAYYRSVRALQGHEGCPLAPCFHSEHLGTPPMPLEGPCSATGRCTVLESILPKRILAMVEQVFAQAQRTAAGEPGLHLLQAVDDPEPPADTSTAAQD